MQAVKATEQSRGQIVNLLKSQKLPSEDLPDVLTDFYIVINAGELIGVIGMERYRNLGLLRSMVVHPDHRNKGVAEKLILKLEHDDFYSYLK